jgi:hypothetical protein
VLGSAPLGAGALAQTFVSQPPYPTGSTSFYVAVGDGTALGSAQLNATVAGSVAGTFVYSPAAGTTPTTGIDTLSVTFTPNDATDYTTATATVALTVESFSVALSGVPTQTVTDGGTATIDLSVSPVGSTTLPAAVTLTVTGLPANTTYTFTPTEVAAGSPATKVTLVIETTNSQTSNSQSARNTEPPSYPTRHRPFPLVPLGFAFAAGGIFCGFRRFKALRLGFAMVALVGISTVLGGCSGGVGTTSATAPGTYVITVTATSGTQHESTTFTLVVQQ